MANTTLLAVIQSLCKRTKMPVPTTVLGSTDVQVIQMQALLEEGLDDLIQRGDWQEMRAEASWTTLAQEDQGSLDTLAPAGLRKFLPETFWDRSDTLPLLGPMTPAEWQFLKAIVITGPRYSFRVMNNHFFSTPAPAAGHRWVFEYLTTKAIYNPSTLQYSDTFTSDNDQILLPAPIVRMDLRWRWKKEKGIDYAEDFNTAEAMITNALALNGDKPVFQLHDYGDNYGPRIGMAPFNSVPKF